MAPGPPQSIPVSVPFLTPSLPLGATHTDLLHAPLKQFAPRAHALPSAHAGPAAPPQSTSLSSPFFNLSVLLGAAHLLPVHTLLSQSDDAAHPAATGQRFVVAADPPQSTPVSSPFLMPSALLDPTHTPPTQLRD
jgi:hypothetical protein